MIPDSQQIHDVIIKPTHQTPSASHFKRKSTRKFPSDLTSTAARRESWLCARFEFPAAVQTVDMKRFDTCARPTFFFLIQPLWHASSFWASGAPCSTRPPRLASLPFKARARCRRPQPPGCVLSTRHMPLPATPSTRSSTRSSTGAPSTWPHSKSARPTISPHLLPLPLSPSPSRLMLLMPRQPSPPAPTRRLPPSWRLRRWRYCTRWQSSSCVRRCWWL